MATHPPLLAELLRRRYWQTHGSFKREYDKAAGQIDRRFVGGWPSRAQFYRWLVGGIKGLPHPDHCRVLEQMLPGYTAAQLFGRESEGPTHGPRRAPDDGDNQIQAVRHVQFDDEFRLTTPMTPNENPRILPFSLVNTSRAGLLYLNWETFGAGIERLISQIKNIGRRVDPDVCFGVNEAGLVMATFLASAQFSRCPVGYLKCLKRGRGMDLSEDSHFPDSVPANPTIVICDYEVKRADVIGHVVDRLRERYGDPELYFAVFGAMTDSDDPRVKSFDELTGAKIMEKAQFSAVFIATTMHPPGIEPPLELR